MLCFCVVFLRLKLYPMLPVSQGCPFLIAHSVFSNVCLQLSQETQKFWYDNGTRSKEDHAGDKVLLLLPLDTSKLQTLSISI